MKIDLKSRFKILLFLYIANFFTVYSQDNFQVKSGFNLSSVAISNGSNLDQPSGFVPAFHIGILISNILDEDYSFEYGLIYNIKGYKVVDFLELKYLIIQHIWRFQHLLYIIYLQ